MNQLLCIPKIETICFFSMACAMQLSQSQHSAVRDNPLKTLANFYYFWPLLPFVGNFLLLSVGKFDKSLNQFNTIDNMH